MDVDALIAEEVQKAAQAAARLFDRPRARAYRRAYARGYWSAAVLTVGTVAGVTTSPLRLHIDADAFARRVDVSSYAFLSG